MTLTFRIAEPGDLATLLQFMAEYYACDHLPFDEAGARSAVAGLLAEPSLGAAWLMHHGETVMGYVVVLFGYSLEYHGHAATLDEIYLRPEYRGQGFGSLALRFVEDFCRGRGIRSLHLEVERDNTRAEQIYRRAGYFTVERRVMKKWVDN
jgi:ribosomal protein S18 acetylase RimI-like enzyme